MSVGNLCWTSFLIVYYLRLQKRHHEVQRIKQGKGKYVRFWLSICSYCKMKFSRLYLSFPIQPRLSEYVNTRVIALGIAYVWQVSHCVLLVIDIARLSRDCDHVLRAHDTSRSATNSQYSDFWRISREASVPAREKPALRVLLTRCHQLSKNKSRVSVYCLSFKLCLLA